MKQTEVDVLKHLGVVEFSSHAQLEADIKKALGLPYCSVEIRSPADHQAQAGYARDEQQKWHQDQNGEPMDLVVWSNVAPTQLRLLNTPPYYAICLCPNFVYRFSNTRYFHRQPKLTPEQLQTRWFVRVQLPATVDSVDSLAHNAEHEIR